MLTYDFEALNAIDIQAGIDNATFLALLHGARTELRRHQRAGFVRAKRER